MTYTPNVEKARRELDALAEKSEAIDFTIIANNIRILAIDCKSRDTLSCEFGNEFAPKVEAYLRKCFE